MLGTPNIDRQARRREDTRREILDAAWAVVQDAGWSGLTQRAVAERVGMRAPSLYGHFASKMDIVDGMFGQSWEEYVASTAELEARIPTEPRAALIMSGAAILQTLMRIWPTSKLSVADRGLREGLLYAQMVRDGVLAADGFPDLVERMQQHQFRITEADVNVSQSHFSDHAVRSHVATTFERLGLI